MVLVPQTFFWSFALSTKFCQGAIRALLGVSPEWPVWTIQTYLRRLIPIEVRQIVEYPLRWFIASTFKAPSEAVPCRFAGIIGKAARQQGKAVYAYATDDSHAQDQDAESLIPS
jgi:hypothetical protein